MKRYVILMLLILPALGLAPAVKAELYVDGFLQGLYGGRLDKANPTSTDYPASETRLQLRAEHFGDNAEFFSRLDFVFDGADSVQYDWELREGYLKFRLGNHLDFKIGRQILTWGTGDLIFINDAFSKDYQSFFVGRDDQYLKAPQNAMRIEYYHSQASLTLVWSPRFEGNRLPEGRRLSYFDPFVGDIVGEEFFIEPTLPDAKFKNSELAFRLSRPIGPFNSSLYFYRGFYKNPLGVDFLTPDPGGVQIVYPELTLYGGSIRGAISGGVLWLEGGYYDSRDDSDGDDPFRPNSSFVGLAGFERQVASNLTTNLQWQVDIMSDYDKFKSQQPAGLFVRDEVRHLLTSRTTKLIWDENLTLSAVLFYSPSDEDAYLRLNSKYLYSDELTLAVGGNFFTGEHLNTEFGQFQQNDNVFVKMTYGF